MTRSSARNVVLVGLAAGAVLMAWQISRRHVRHASLGPPRAITIDYPAEGSIFPPEFTAPTWLWRDDVAEVATWEIDIAFSRLAQAISEHLDELLRAQ